MSQAPADLEIRGLTVRFGGLVAVDNLFLRAPAGMITGLIGPNGAGKTTTLNAATGFIGGFEGEVLLGGQRLDRRSPPARAQRGLGRTFQRMELFASMTVLENVALGREAHLAGRRPWRQLIATGEQRRDVQDRTHAALTRCGITHLAGRAAGDLSTGQQRLVELARALAGGYTFLVLDEPSSGLDEEETDRFAQMLLDVVHEDGIGILLVEHDMSLVRRCCTYLYVLDFGQCIIDGPAPEVLASDILRAAYLGREAA